MSQLGAERDAELGYKTAIELKAHFAKGELSPVEVTRAIFARIHAHNPSLNAFSTLIEEQASAAARESETRIREGRARRLEGVPVTIKDAFDVEGMQTDQNCFAMPTPVAAKDNPVVERLRAEGAVILGKTLMSELAWSGVSRNPVYGVTHNPWGHGLNAGASSAGAAVAAAAGFGPLHLGSDGGGSIRMPCHFCGVFGLKPTYGRVPHIPVSNNDYGTHNGPMTRSVADSALMLEVIAGPHHLDHTCCERAPAPYLEKLETSLKGKKIAFSLDLGHARVDPQIAEVVREAARVFASELQANVEEVTPAWGPLGPDLGRFFWRALQGRRAPLLDGWEDQMGADLVACIKEGTSFSSSDYVNTRERKFAYVAQISDFLEEYDFLITPTCSVEAFPAELVRPKHWPQHAWDWLAWSEFLYPFNLSGHPAASVPCGLTPTGLPVGLQIVSKRFDDLGVLQAAASFQKARPHLNERPTLVN